MAEKIFFEYMFKMYAPICLKYQKSTKRIHEKLKNFLLFCKKHTEKVCETLIKSRFFDFLKKLQKSVDNVCTI